MMSKFLTSEDQIECRRIAYANGFKIEQDNDGAWSKSESNEDLGVVWITVDSQRTWYVGVDDRVVAERLIGKRSTIKGPGSLRFQLDSIEECEKFIDQVYKVSKATPTDPLSLFERATEHLTEQTEEARLVRQRIGQDVLRRKLLKSSQSSCVLTGIDDATLLKVSHIKPWAKCASDKERLDTNNCLLLSALWDAAFDSGLVTIDKKGCPVFSNQLRGKSKENLLWTHPIKLNNSNLKYLEWHRENVFLR